MDKRSKLRESQQKLHLWRISALLILFFLGYLVSQENKEVFSQTSIVATADFSEFCNEPLHFLNQTDKYDGKKFFALASVPGSGNTFARILFESATRIHTGSVYNDNLLKPVFYGEGRLDSVLLAKTHYPCGGCWTIGKKKLPVPEIKSGHIPEQLLLGTIYIVRNPLRAFLAEFQRRQLTIIKNHQKPKGMEMLDTHTAKLNWVEYLKVSNPQKALLLEKELFKFIQRWKRSVEFYRDHPNTMTIFFEDLTSDRDTRGMVLESAAKFMKSKAAEKLGKNDLINPEQVGVCARMPIERAEMFHRKKQTKKNQIIDDQVLQKACVLLKATWIESKWGDCALSRILV